MESTAALAVDLALLTAALDQTGIDIAELLRSLERDVMAAVPSYLALAITVRAAVRSYTFRVPAERDETLDVRASIKIPLGTASASSASLIIYASQPGGCLDLGADLAWLTGNELIDFDLDADLVLPPWNPVGLGDASTIDQAIGALMAGGHTPDQANHELDARALAAAGDRLSVAEEILATLPATDGSADE